LCWGVGLKPVQIRLYLLNSSITNAHAAAHPCCIPDDLDAYCAGRLDALVLCWEERGGREVVRGAGRGGGLAGVAAKGVWGLNVNLLYKSDTRALIKDHEHATSRYSGGDLDAVHKVATNTRCELVRRVSVWVYGENSAVVACPREFASSLL
jgi:hypothetical protein